MCCFIIFEDQKNRFWSILILGKLKKNILTYLRKNHDQDIWRHYVGIEVFFQEPQRYVVPGNMLMVGEAPRGVVVAACRRVPPRAAAPAQAVELIPKVGLLIPSIHHSESKVSMVVRAASQVAGLLIEWCQSMGRH